jgi:hypothetical protein
VALIVKTQDPSEGCTRQRVLRQLGSWLGRGPAGDGRAQLLAGIPAGLVAAVVEYIAAVQRAYGLSRNLDGTHRR